MKKKLLSVSAFLSILLSLNAQPVRLDSILNEIEKSSHALKVYDADIRAADAAAKGARNWMPPELGTGFWMTPYNPRYWRKGDNGTFGMGQYQVSVQQMIPGKQRLDAEEAYMNSLSGAISDQKNAALNNLYAEAKKNFYQWIINKKKLSILDQNEKLLNFMVQSSEIRYKNGLGKINAYYKARAALGNIQNMRIESENEIRQHQIVLNTLMNRDKLHHFDIDTIFRVKDYSSASYDSITFINSRSDIKAIESEIQINSLQQRLENSKLKPEFGLRYEHMFGFGGLPMQYTLMGMVKIPMAGWSSRSSRANIESLKWKMESLNQQKQSEVNEAIGKSYEVSNNLEAKRNQIKLFDENILPALQRNYQSIQLAYEQNTEELFSLFDAWETLHMTQLEYLNQLQDLLMLQVELEQILEAK